VHVLSHVNGQVFEPGDRVCGVLPLALAARICASGAQAHVISYDVPESLRGQELSAAMLEALGAKLVQYDVRIVGSLLSTATSPVPGASPAHR
jgi:CRISPR-associated protein Csx16